MSTLCSNHSQNTDFRFESEIKDGEDHESIHGKLSIEIAAIKLKGEGEIKSVEKVTEFSENTRCEFFGDYTGIKPTLTLEQAKKTILALDDNTSNPDGVPILVTLEPLSRFTNAAKNMVRDLSAGAVNEAGRLLQDIEDTQVRMSTLENSQTARAFKVNYGTLIGIIATSYRNRASRLKGDLCKILPLCKGNGAEETKLMALITKYDSEVFSRAATEKWIATLEQEVRFVDTIIETAGGVEGMQLATNQSDFQSLKFRAFDGIFYLEAKFLSRLKVTGNEGQGIVSLLTPSEGPALDVESFLDKFQQQFSAMRRAISREKTKAKKKFSTILFLDYMSDENKCNTNFYEYGKDVLHDVDADADITGATVKYDPVKGAVTGEIGRVANEGGILRINLRFKEKKEDKKEDKKEGKKEDEKDDQKDQKEGETDTGNEDESSWFEKTFDHAAHQGNFELQLREHDQLREGVEYVGQLRYEIT